jgi:L-arabinose isomerase
MWINGLKILHKPMLHLHTQFNREIPWETIDMDFMNLNQSAHGDREFGFICTRMNIRRKVIAGYWQDDRILKQMDNWARAAIGVAESLKLKVARFGDNMREVAVTEGNKVTAQIQFGFSVNGYGVGDLVKYVNAVTDAEIDSLVKEYKELYTLKSSENIQSIREAAKLEIGLKTFLEDENFGAFTTTFEDLHGLQQLPGLASQRLMAQGYGFGAEGDWKTAALLRIMKCMSKGLPGGTSFMEDYTYHLETGREKVLGAHMLEVCPSIASSKPSLEVHPLGIGGKEPPARLVFTGATGPALNVSLIDLGDKFRLIINEVDAVEPDAELPELPVARVMWIPRPDFKTALEAWLHAGGAHHTVYSQSVTSEILKDFADMTNIETIILD